MTLSKTRIKRAGSRSRRLHRAAIRAWKRETNPAEKERLRRVMFEAGSVALVLSCPSSFPQHIATLVARMEATP